jgi:two-component system CheB/CheR fusion protein
MATPPEPPEDAPGLDALLDYLKRVRAFDFTGYKPASLGRRIRKHMQAVGVGQFGDYVDYLEVHPDEFAQLFNTILINVTAFFRDPPAWEALARDALPRLLAAKGPDALVRVWSAGCASGEEAYTLAMVLGEALGFDAFRERVKIYGTDVDTEALNQARQAAYAPRQVAGVPEALLAEYFEKQNDRHVFHKDLRRSIIFGRHDLIQDAPISRLDLLVCRNTLMYFNAETQTRILDRFNFALNEGGILFLGKAEMMLTQGNSFIPVDLKRRIFSRGPRPNHRDRAWVASRSVGAAPPSLPANHFRLREAAFDQGVAPRVVIDANGFLALANQPARAVFGLTAQDLGRPLQDLELSFRPVELRSAIQQACAAARPVTLKAVESRNPPAEPVFFDVQVAPLQENGGGILGVVVTYTDVTPQLKLEEELQQSSRELESAYEELQSTNEELETTNEELQSTVEELETTNEELQSTNEELVTMNEELQSANEELQTINDELRQRSDELNQVNGFLESILTSLKSGVAVVDRNLHVLSWNRQAEKLWGLRGDEVRGHNFLNLDIGLPVGELRPAIRACLTGEAAHQEVEVGATNRRGRAVPCRVTLTPLAGRDGEPSGAILLMEDRSGVGRDGPAPEKG